jgi:hypothetical protein
MQDGPQCRSGPNAIHNSWRKATLKKMNPFDLTYEQYQRLKKKFSSASDPQEKNMLLKRLVNLLAVMEFLINLNNVQ